jgi:hypothetical protein
MSFAVAKVDWKDFRTSGDTVPSLAKLLVVSTVANRERAIAIRFIGKWFFVVFEFDEANVPAAVPFVNS